MPQLIVFTDLDGTLLDSQTYSFEAALPALEWLNEKGIPLVFCSSKTRTEIEQWRLRLDNSHPFVAENGGGIFVPLSCFPRDEIDRAWEKVERVPGYEVLVLGTPYRILRRTMKDLRAMGFGVRGFGDMNVAEVAEITGLNPEEAELAKTREYDEPFVFSEDPARVGALLASIEARGLRHSRGRLHHLMGENDKGKAVQILQGLYRAKYGEILTIALGDSPVDLPMLAKVDYPILVQNERGTYDPSVELPNLIKADGIGPHGWNRTLLGLMEEHL